MLRTLLIIAGFASLALGIIGIFLPILPTTPFLLLSAFCFYRGSGRLYEKLMNHKVLGPYIRDFREYRAIPLHTKIFSVSLLWITITLSAIFATDKLWLRILLGVIAVGVTIHILSFKTKR